MGTLFGKQLLDIETDTFNLKDIDPTTIKVTNSCEPFDTAEGKPTSMNCEDEAGLQMEFKTQNAKPLIHRERVSSSSKSKYGDWRVENERKHSPDDLCEKVRGNMAYCDINDVKEPPTDVTSDTVVFRSPAYTNRFIKAFRHAVELCGGKPCTF